VKRSRKIVLTPAEQALLQDAVAECSDAALRTRYLILLHSAQGWSRPRIAEALQCSESLVSRVRRRWQEEGEAGLIDRREDNGEHVVSDEYIVTLRHILRYTPREYGHRRPTWTQSLLIAVCGTITGIRISRTTMGRLLRSIKARRGRPKPLAPCPWSEKDRKRRVKLLHRLIRTLPADQVAVWEDEADIDLNPRIASDWTLPGVQRVVMTPGKNVKRYIAGAMDVRSDRLTWVTGRKKDSGLFIALLDRLQRTHAAAKLIHVLLDNYTIHSSKRTQAWLRERGGRIRLHFLPPYCPDDNRIERCVWREMHANVTNNHPHAHIDDLMHEVSVWLRRRNRSRHVPTVAELREAI
jgi:transposase